MVMIKYKCVQARTVRVELYWLQTQRGSDTRVQAESLQEQLDNLD